MNDLFKDIRDNNRLLYEFVCGSHLYGLNTADSDLDTKGIFISDKNTLLGLNGKYIDQVSDERNDTNWYELGKFANMLLTSNPTVLESLFVPEKHIIGEIHPIMSSFMDNRNEFVTKQCFKPFVDYALNQIHKARGLNKKIVNPVTERLQPLDFAYTFYKQGSTKIQNYLDHRGLKQQYCGLVHIPNMHDVYGIYYDFGKHISDANITLEALQDIVCGNINNTSHCNLLIFYCEYYGCELCDAPRLMMNEKAIGYRGIINVDGKSNDLRLSSVSKNLAPICYITYNQSGYTKHCIQHKEYTDWVKFRNQKRYESNLNKNYDSKNLMHTFRLISMGKEIANGDGILLDRKEVGDADFLLDIRNHKYEYDDLILMCDEKEKELKIAIENSSIKENVDSDLVNSLLINSRKKYYGVI